MKSPYGFLFCLRDDKVQALSNDLEKLILFFEGLLFRRSQRKIISKKLLNNEKDVVLWEMYDFHFSWEQVKFLRKSGFKEIYHETSFVDDRSNFHLVNAVKFLIEKKRNTYFKIVTIPADIRFYVMKVKDDNEFIGEGRRWNYFSSGHYEKR